MTPDTIVQGIGLIVLPIILAMVAFIVGWLMTIRKDLDAHKLHVSENYTKKEDLSNALTKIENTLEKIFDRINSLAERRVHARDCERPEI